MCLQANHFSSLIQILTPSELEHFLLLLADRKVAQAVRDRDFRMLAITFNVSITTYEDLLLEQKGIVFTNRPNRFEVRKARQPILEVQDDHLGTVGCAIVGAMRNAARSTLPSAYLGGKRYRPSTEDCLAVIDRGGLARVLSALKDSHPVAGEAVLKVKKAHDVVSGLDYTDAPEKAGIWADYVGAVLSLYSQLRTSPDDVLVTDPHVNGDPITLAEYVKRRDVQSFPALRSKGETWTPGEQQFFEALELPGYVDVSAGFKGHAVKVKAERSIYEYIGDEHRGFPTLPDVDMQMVAADPSMTAQPQSSTAPVASDRPGQLGFGDPAGILRDFYHANMNSHRKEGEMLKNGGFSEHARAEWKKLSKAKQRDVLKAITVEERPIATYTRGIAEFLNIPEDAAEEIIAAKLVLSKSAFRVDVGKMTVRRNM